MTNNTRGRNWLLVIFKGDYEDIAQANGETQANLKKWAENGEINYCFIFHDKDIEEDGTQKPKRLHSHYVISMANARSFASMKKTFPSAHIEQISNLGASIQYLTHKNNSEKYQYDYSLISTNNKEWLERFYNTTIIKASDYIDNERELLKDLRDRKYKTLFDLIDAEKYSMDFLNKKIQIIKAYLLGLQQREEYELIQIALNKSAQESVKKSTPNNSDIEDIF